MLTRARIWAVITIAVVAYLIFNNMNRLPEYGADLADMWPFLSIALGFLILFRRKGRAKHDFFFNNTKIQKQLEELNQQLARRDTEQPNK
jgi:hypothetical protein